MTSIIYFVIRYRRRDPDYVPSPVHESRWIETASIVIPTILVLIVFTWGFRVFVKMYAAPPDSYQVTVRGVQWAWQFEYDTGAVTTNELHVPVGTPVKLNMSAADVLHSFFIPDFRVKHDVLPNRYTSLWFEATEVGEYQIYCTEYCGTEHSTMLATLVVESEADFAQWLADQNAERTPEELGEQLFAQCAACHTTDGTPSVGPTMQGIFGSTRQLDDGTSAVADDNYLRESILDPATKVVQGFPPVMPAVYSGLLDAQQLDGLIAYIKTLQ